MSSTHFSRTRRGLAWGAVAGAGVLAYAAGWEVRNFVVRQVEIPCLPTGQRPIRVLHLSDFHLTPRQRKKQAWIRGLAAWQPDLVVNTGDNLAHMEAVPVLLAAVSELLQVPGVFVFGSNDYYKPGLRNPLGYLLPDDGSRFVDGPKLPVADLRAGFTEAGWLDLTNQTGNLQVGDTKIAFAGVDDPHLNLDDLAALPAVADPAADLRVAVAHAPYLRVLDSFAAQGYDTIFAGHTHGGQVRLPGVGALATNCDLEPARARGLHTHPARVDPHLPGNSWLHVSAGAGTNPYTPVRFCCRPEASLVTLTAK